MEKLNKFINKTKRSYKSLPDKKQYIEFFTAALTVALYNPPQGTTRFQLKVKSIVTGEEKILTRTFMYKGVFDISPTASNSAN